MGDASDIIRLITSENSDTASVSEAVNAFEGDRNELLSRLISFKADMRARGVPGNTADHVIEGDYMEAIPDIVRDDRAYRLASEAEMITSPGIHDDVDLRSVTQLYLELVDIVVVDLKEACARCRVYPEKEHLDRIRLCLSHIELLLKAGGKQLSLRSTESPATLRSKGAKAVARCKECITSVTHGTGLDLPELDAEVDGLCDVFWSICDSRELAELQERRNESWRADHQWIHDWLTKKVMEMNGQVEDLDLTDMTQRRYLGQLISLSQDVLNDYGADH